MKPYYSEDGVEIYWGDCREVLENVPQMVDGVFFDPPYGLEIAAWDRALTCLEVVPRLKGMLREGGSLYATCSSHILLPMLEALAPDRVIAWGKPNLPMRKHLMDWEWSTEFVLRWVKGGTPTPFQKPHGEACRDYWRIPVENGFLNHDALTHPARKPLALLSRILSASTAEGRYVLDPLMGSGTTLIAARRLSLRAIGIEIEERYCEIAAKRLSQRILPLEFGT